MKLLSKGGKEFWVEDFNEEQEQFFISLGFNKTEVPQIQKDFGFTDYLSFGGSEVFGMWSKKEKKEIYKKTANFLDLKNIKKIIIKPTML